MKTNLKYIDDTYSTVLEKQTKFVPVSMREKFKKESVDSIAGFAVPNPATVDKRVADHIDKMKKYAIERATLVNELTAKDIPVLASLPGNVWNEICKASGLIQMSPDREGRVDVNIEGLTDKFVSFAKKMTVFTTIAVVYAISFMFGCYIGEPKTPIQFLITGFLSGLCAVIPIMFSLWLEDEVWWQRKMWLRIALFFSSANKLTIKAIQTGYRRERAYLVLPNPPADVQATLLKAFPSYGLKVAAVPDAIGLSPPIKDLILSKGKRDFEEEARRREEIRRDPIIYIERGDTVAIIAQFGDFPIEQKLIDDLIKKEVTEEIY